MRDVEKGSPIPGVIALGIPAAILLGLLAYLNHLQELKLRSLSENAVITTGRIVGKQCQNHGHVRYSFEVGGKHYFGEDTCTSGFCDDARIGDLVNVTYSKTDPSNFECRSLGEVGGTKRQNYYGLFVLAALIVLGIFQAVRTDDVRSSLEKRRRKLKAPD